MPENCDFSLEVLVGTTPLPEYEKDGHYYVESNLSTPNSYTTSGSDSVGGETETQNWPVTPYSLRLNAKWLTDTYYYRVMVDGVKVKGLSLVPGQSREITGFRDGPCLREFLFSLPRFAKDENDRIEDGRECQIGVISVECWNAVLKTTKYGLRKNFLDFKQANKKDSSRVTQGHHLMATSKAGKVVASRSLYRSVDSWKLQSLRSQLQVRYHMGHTLQEMGFTLVPIVWQKAKKRPHKSKSSKKKVAKKTASAEQSQEDDDAGSDEDAMIVDEASPGDKVMVKKETMDQPVVQNSEEVIDLTLDSDAESDENDADANKKDSCPNVEATKSQAISVLRKATSAVEQMKVDEDGDLIDDENDDVLDAEEIDRNENETSKDNKVTTTENEAQENNGNIEEIIYNQPETSGGNELIINNIVGNCEIQDNVVNSNPKMTSKQVDDKNDNERHDGLCTETTGFTNVKEKNAELKGLSNKSSDVFSEPVAPMKAKKTDLNATFDSEASFGSIDYESDLLNTSADSDGDFNLKDPIIDPTVQLTGGENEKTETEPSKPLMSVESAAVPELTVSVTNPTAEPDIEPTVQPTAQQDNELPDAPNPEEATCPQVSLKPPGADQPLAE